jgi:hypothetical protein
MQASSEWLATASTILGVFVAAALYAQFLHSLNKAYEKNYTWLTVMGGVALVGAVVGVRFALPLPDLAAHALLWWAWLICVGHFVAAAVPIIAWQLWVDRSLKDEANGHAA